jgi:hypothetical protein
MDLPELLKRDSQIPNAAAIFFPSPAAGPIDMDPLQALRLDPLSCLTRKSDAVSGEDDPNPLPAV